MTRSCVANQIGDEGAQAAMEALKANRTVVKIDLTSECTSYRGEETCIGTDVMRCMQTITSDVRAAWLCHRR